MRTNMENKASHLLAFCVSIVCAAILFCNESIAFVSDSASFDPLIVPIEAKGSGGVPVGTIIAWPVATDPDDMENWLECNGQAINSTAYPELFSLVGSVVPDMRGLFLRGYGSQSYAQNNGSVIGVTQTVYSSGALGGVQGDAMRNVIGEHNSTSFLGIWRGGECREMLWSGAFYCGRVSDYDGVTRVETPVYYSSQGSDQSGKFGVNASRITPTANENRPVNKAVRYLIRALP
jgi:hypothetical protein